ncbi:hypothetical protein [Streptomonospora wellingtoniae]|uniref:Uncharacterized protein n=1 Tax=Streptomonospora wellingtoniae TaxID=3075544 RepID=A0ABU2KYQ8_9ACTN|nr:hypothetical protein [Streptomonospora sp. DSM 45055]MDT0304435.1 hypothetical protein [Streptomonospora sp. DSM 45055]
MRPDYALGHALHFGADIAWPQLPFAGPALGAFAALAIVVLAAALVRAVCRAGVHAASDTAYDSRCDHLLRSAQRAPEPPVRAPDTPGKPLPRAPGRAAAIG